MMNKIKLKESIYVLKESENFYKFIFTSTRKIKTFKVDLLVKSLIDYLGSPKEEKQIFNQFKNYNEKNLSNCINSLEKEGIIRKYNEEDIKGKYAKQVLFLDELTSSWKETIDLQHKIEKSKISVFGIGGIGTWIVNSLSQIGVKEIRISDPDKIEENNLNRQLYFSKKDIGKYKVDVIKDKLEDTKIIGYKKLVSDNENLEEIIKETDFIVNCADHPSVEKTTSIIDKYAEKLNIPYCVAGGYNMHLGMVGPIIIPGKTVTFQDFLDYQKSNDSLSYLEKVKDIDQTGNLGPIAGAIANIQSMEIFKYLIGKGNLNLNKFAEIDFMDFNVNWIKIK